MMRCLFLSLMVCACFSTSIFSIPARAQAPETGLQAWRISAAAPGQRSLIMFCSGILALAGVMSGRVNP
jgi:hypothetical protein